MPPLIPVPVAVNPPSGAFPATVVSIPGAGAGAAAAAAWVGRRISQRTSTLLSDAFAALASPTTPSVPKTREDSSPSLLDDDDGGDNQDAEFGEWTAALAPERMPPTPALASSSSLGKAGTKDTDADGEEWNW